MVFPYKLLGLAAVTGREVLAEPKLVLPVLVVWMATKLSDHCALHTNRQPLCCASETNVVISVHYFSMKTRLFLEEKKKRTNLKKRSFLFKKHMYFSEALGLLLV